MMHVSFCPFGDACTKKGKRLGADLTSDMARQRIITHLMNSPYHALAQDDAESAASAADITTKDADDANESAAGGSGDGGHHGGRWSADDWNEWHAQRSGKGKGKGKGKSRSGPYHDEQPYAGRGTDEVAVHRHSPDFIARLATAIGRAEAGCRAASRMARQACAAFEDEANVLREALDQIRNIR